MKEKLENKINDEDRVVVPESFKKNPPKSALEGYGDVPDRFCKGCRQPLVNMGNLPRCPVCGTEIGKFL